MIVRCGQGALLLLLCWWLLAILADMPIIPLPSDVIGRLARIFNNKILVHSLYSLARILGGLILAVVVGYPLGILMGYFLKVDRFFSPILYLTYPVPKIALLPTVMLLFGVGETSKLILVFLIIVFQIVITVRDTARTIPAETYYTLISLGADLRQLVVEAIFPYTLPKLISSIRIAMATAISVLFFTETYGTRYGMGYFIMDSFLRVNYLDMYSGILVLSLIGLVLFVLLDCLEKRVCRWQNLN